MTNKSLLLGVVALCALPTVGLAQNLVTNGGFESTDALHPGSQIRQASCTDPSGVMCGIINPNFANHLEHGTPFPTLPGWEATGLVVLFFPGTADNGLATGAQHQFFGQSNLTNTVAPHSTPTFALWGTRNGGTTDIPATSPADGNFLALDANPPGAGVQGSIQQTIANKFVPGDMYQVSFFWAAGQEKPFNGPNMQQLRVSLGPNSDCFGPDTIEHAGGGGKIGCSEYTEVLETPNHSFQHWREGSFTFAATSSTEMLNFLAIGAPGGLPPIVLLDGVSVMKAGAPVPEPVSLSLFGLGFAGLWFARRWRSP